MREDKIGWKKDKRRLKRVKLDKCGQHGIKLDERVWKMMKEDNVD